MRSVLYSVFGLIEEVFKGLWKNMARNSHDIHDLSTDAGAQPAAPAAVTESLRLWPRDVPPGCTDAAAMQEAAAHRLLDRVRMRVHPMPTKDEITRALWITGDAVGIQS